MRRSLRRRSPDDSRGLIVARALIETGENRGMPSRRSDARSTDLLSKMDVRLKRSIRTWKEGRVIDDREQRHIVDTISDADTFDAVGLISQPLLPPITP